MKYYEIRQLAAKMSLKVFFSIFSSGGHCVQPSGTFLAIWVKSNKRLFCKIILKSGHWSRKRCRLKIVQF